MFLRELNGTRWWLTIAQFSTVAWGLLLSYALGIGRPLAVVTGDGDRRPTPQQWIRTATAGIAISTTTLGSAAWIFRGSSAPIMGVAGMVGFASFLAVFDERVWSRLVELWRRRVGPGGRRGSNGAAGSGSAQDRKTR